MWNIILKPEELGKQSEENWTPELTPEKRIELARWYYSEQVIEQTSEVK
jgi:hypothetical protein